MNRQKWLLSVAAMTLMGGTATVLYSLKGNQKLGPPGIVGTAIPGSVAMNIDLPENVLDFTSERVPTDEITLNTLPKDTSFAQRRYIAPDSFWIHANIVLMGTDRTSLHKPEFCLPGQGWHIDNKTAATIPLDGAEPYSLPVMKWVISNALQAPDGRRVEVRGIYVFWFVAHNEQTTSHWQRMWWLARDLMTTGVLQRWAYVRYFSVCQPGQEDVTFERMKQFIAASVPEFQPTPKPATATVADRH
jgi:hypothetical protein